uniref:Uncharacterized protein n=1 Tax=Lepeophtheirus salmonis TaxID=72036 RepID=A0A0K2UYS2_LEPSM
MLTFKASSLDSQKISRKEDAGTQEERKDREEHVSSFSSSSYCNHLLLKMHVNSLIILYLFVKYRGFLHVFLEH